MCSIKLVTPNNKPGQQFKLSCASPSGHGDVRDAVPEDISMNDIDVVHSLSIV